MRASVERLIGRDDTEYLLGGEPADGRRPAALPPQRLVRRRRLPRRGRLRARRRRAAPASAARWSSAAIERARLRGCRRLELDTGEENAPALALYRLARLPRSDRRSGTHAAASSAGCATRRPLDGARSRARDASPRRGARLTPTPVAPTTGGDARALTAARPWLGRGGRDCRGRGGRHSRHGGRRRPARAADAGSRCAASCGSTRAAQRAPMAVAADALAPARSTARYVRRGVAHEPVEVVDRRLDVAGRQHRPRARVRAALEPQVVVVAQQPVVEVRRPRQLVEPVLRVGPDPAHRQPVLADARGRRTAPAAPRRAPRSGPRRPRA